LSEIEVDEVFRLMCHVAAKVTSYDAVPRRVVLLVKLLLDVRRYILFNVVLLERLRCAVDGILLHVLGHISILDDGLPVGHLQIRQDSFYISSENKVIAR